jgi:lipooligosaccharide transport system permease protein
MATLNAATRVVEHNVLLYRRWWRNSMLVAFFTPLFFLTAMGLGLGGLINRGSGGVNGVPYIDFLAPGLLATTTMQLAAFGSMYPILGRIMWDRIYDAMLATPLAVRDLVIGEVVWMAMHLTITATISWLVMAMFGVAHTFESALAIPAATLNGLAFATPIMAFAALQRNDSGFSWFTRFVITPLFLFGGAFFPISRLPVALQVVAQVTPLAHGVDLCRGLVLGTLTAEAASIDLVVLLAYVAGGIAIAWILFERRLSK